MFKALALTLKNRHFWQKNVKNDENGENRGKPWFLAKMAKSGVPGKSECPWQSIFPTLGPRRL
jgi:hypothetical protein